MDIAIPIYDEFTALDAVGPYEVLSRLPGARVRFIAPTPGAVTTDNGMLSLVAEASLDERARPRGARRAGRDLVVGASPATKRSSAGSAAPTRPRRGRRRCARAR